MIYLEGQTFPSYLINWGCNPFLERLTWFIKKPEQFSQSNITTDIAAWTLTLSVNWPCMCTCLYCRQVLGTSAVTRRPDPGVLSNQHHKAGSIFTSRHLPRAIFWSTTWTSLHCTTVTHTIVWNFIKTSVYLSTFPVCRFMNLIPGTTSIQTSSILQDKLKENIQNNTLPWLIKCPQWFSVTIFRLIQNFKLFKTIISSTGKRRLSLSHKIPFNHEG